MQVKSSLNLKQKSNCHNECLSRKRSSNWRPPVDTTVCVNSSVQQHKSGSYMKPQINCSLNSINSGPRQNHAHKLSTLDEGFTSNGGDIETNYRKKHENRHYWPRSRHKDKSGCLISTSEENTNISDSHQQNRITTSSIQTSKIDLHSVAPTSVASVVSSDIHSRCLQEHRVNYDEDEGDFVFRKITNLFFRRNQIHSWQCNFFKWLNGCYTKTLFNAGGSDVVMRCKKKTMSYFGGGISTIMLFLLIFSILISGPGEAYPVEGGMYMYHFFKDGFTT